MMGSNSGMSSFPSTGQRVSWFVDSSESPVPATPTHAPSPQDFPEKNQRATGPSKTPLLLSPSETCRGEMNTFPKKTSQGTLSRRKALRRSRPILLQTDSHSPAKHTEKERKSDNIEKHQNIFSSSEEEPKPHKGKILNKEKPRPLSPEGGNFLRLRSSPVISRRPRPLSWHGRRTPPANPSSLELLSSSGSTPLKASSVENLGSKVRSRRCLIPVQVDDDRNSISLSSDRNSVSQSADRNSVSLSSDRNSVSLSSDRNSVSQSSDRNSVSLSSDRNSVSQSSDRNSVSLSSDRNSVSLSSDRNSVSLSSDRNSVSQSSDRNSVSLSSDRNSVSLSSDRNSVSLSSDRNSVSLSSDRNSVSLSSDRNSISLSSDRNSVSLSSDRNSILSSHSQSGSIDGDSREIFQRRRNEDCCTSSPHASERALSGVSDFTADIFKACCELEKENAHFIVVDMVLEVLEGAKWTLSFDQRTALMEKHQNMRQNAQNHTSSAQHSLPHKQRCKTHRHTQDYSKNDGEPERNKDRPSESDMKTSHSQSDGHQPTGGKDDGESRTNKPEQQPKMCSVLSTDSGFEDCGLDITLASTESDRNDAEYLAQRLVSQFKRNWLPSDKLWRGRQSLRSSLQELPGTEGVVSSRGSLTEEIQIRTRMRGSLTWAPPCFQIIFTLHPAHRRSEMVALQNFLCAGCGTEVEPRYIKKLRYCEYLGRYFCDCCHSGSEAVIPARILSCWDFSRYSVSDFSKHLLDSVWLEPLFDLTCVGTTLCSRVKELSKFRDLQEQLMGIKKLLKACRFSRRVLAEFDQFPAHLTEAPLFFSMNDLLMAKKGQLAAPARALLLSAIGHVESCELCLSRGFICEFCRRKDVIFPFQRNICKRCKVCRACFHKHCFMGRNCPKCARIQSRTKVQMCP